MEIKNIKTPEDILKYMNEHIKYGWIDVDGNRHVESLKNFRRLYRTSSLYDTITSGLGTCIEQVFLMKKLLDKINVPNKMFCTRVYEPDDYDNLDEEEHMHCFILYYQDGKVYQMEHPNWERIGIYEFDSEEEAIEKINKIYIDMTGGKARPVTQFFLVEPNMSFQEFNNYINWLDEEKNKPNLV